MRQLGMPVGIQEGHLDTEEDAKGPQVMSIPDPFLEMNREVLNKEFFEEFSIE